MRLNRARTIGVAATFLFVFASAPVLAASLGTTSVGSNPASGSFPVVCTLDDESGFRDCSGRVTIFFTVPANQSLESASVTISQTPSGAVSYPLQLFDGMFPPQILGSDFLGDDTVGGFVTSATLAPLSGSGNFSLDFFATPSPNLDAYSGTVDWSATITTSAVQAIPGPAALPLLLSAIGGLAGFGWFRRRTGIATA